MVYAGKEKLYESDALIAPCLFAVVSLESFANAQTERYIKSVERVAVVTYTIIVIDNGSRDNNSLVVPLL